MERDAETPTPPPPPPPPYPTPIGRGRGTPDASGRRRTRRTRVVCIADTHRCTPPVPAGDVLIHAGDLTNEGTLPELRRQVDWLRRLPHEVKIVVAGNHDLALDAAFYREYGPGFHHGRLQDVEACRALLISGGETAEAATETETERPGKGGKGMGEWIYLEHESRSIRLTSPNGPRTEFTVFGSPYTPQNPGSQWAFQYPRAREDDGAAAACKWAQIPLDTDILVTHGPAFTHRDEQADRVATGCEELRKAMWRVRPRLAVCGHVHDARGAERVRWDLARRGVQYKEDNVEPWTDPAPEGKKISLVDLTGKTVARALDNNGSKAVFHDDYPSPAPLPSVDGTGDKPAAGSASPGIGTRGLGGNGDSARSDRPALAGRLGRQETCVVNAAIQTSGYPHTGPRRLNKAIVVDLDLPVWEEEAEGGGEKEPTGSRRPEKDGTPAATDSPRGPARAQQMM